jgi:hypothetical protein
MCRGERSRPGGEDWRLTRLESVRPPRLECDAAVLICLRAGVAAISDQESISDFKFQIQISDSDFRFKFQIQIQI